MIVECPHCHELLRTGNVNLSPGQELSAKCPRCAGEGLLTGCAAQTVCPDHNPDLTVAPKQRLDHDGKSLVSHSSDFTLPEDAFNHFRFPAETESQRSGASTKRNLRMFIFAGVSVLVVVLFAALVNVVLPGPRPYKLENTGLPVGVNFDESSGVSGR